MTDRGDRLVRAYERERDRLDRGAVEVLLHARRVAAGEEHGVVRRGIDVGPAHRLEERRGLRHGAIEPDGLGSGAQLTEHDAGDEPRIARRCRASLGGEHHPMAGLGQELPRHRDLGDVEVAVRQR